MRNSIANPVRACPVLFHLCCVCLYVTEADNLLSLGLAWLFVALRYAHAFIHVTSNRLRFRQPLFMAGFIVLFAMWTCFPSGWRGAEVTQFCKSVTAPLTYPVAGWSAAACYSDI